MPPNVQDWRAAAAGAAAAAAVSILTPQFAPNFVRPDPHTGADARLMGEALRAELNHELALLRADLALTLPPEPTRRRIEALEEALRGLSPTFRPPTQRFGRQN